tara:strand:- start:7 stop:537 length:531 start_codon:yes stop_codon:yes gene_type:complete
MALLNDCSHFSKTKNDYYTTKQMWKNISDLIPKDKIIWEACLLNSKSKSLEYWKDMGYNVVGNNTWDCLNYYPINYDIIVTNPPFETKIKTKILKHLYKLDKPFILVLNVMNVFSKYMRDIFGDDMKYLQVIYPQGKIKFEIIDEETQELKKAGDPSFYCVYLAYKMDIPQDKLYL